ncbi:hypothetical protein B0T26DRAFT_146758 [Lasiosphaeria miniovina]|uniref:Uncharacterized protein n=1 Tax=Lasiosphaeria miniovina TaxID=1954250 RepID=A0AA40E7F2_9PEZI|nr:uncharacterized protein B0T26DRAFT_146758 [Lasiosphaeria miniovina]KAK0727837.1 hypothetical protein B0T26DRAFT_146758 [Lasiosphaeria miniovina]
MSALDGIDAALRAVFPTAKERRMSLSRAFKAVNDGGYYPTAFRSAKLISLVFGEDEDGVFLFKKTKMTYKKLCNIFQMEMAFLLLPSFSMTRRSRMSLFHLVSATSEDAYALIRLWDPLLCLCLLIGATLGRWSFARA